MPALLTTPQRPPRASAASSASPATIGVADVAGDGRDRAVERARQLVEGLGRARDQHHPAAPGD